MKTKTITSFGLICLFGAMLLSSGCATIIGGSKYYAHVEVKDDAQASIFYQNDLKGKGFAIIKVPRTDANNFTVVVKHQDCDDQTFNFRERSFRGWAFVGTIVTWTGVYEGIPLPWGIVVDAATGAFWKPDVMERGVSKIDYKNFKYTLEYTGCKSVEPSTIPVQSVQPVQNMTNPAQKTKYEKLSDLKELLDKGVLTQEEFDREKKKLLEENN